MVCLFSKHLVKLHYSELGGVLNAMGFEGCDLTVREGGHVLPEKAPADLVRAIESLRGEGVEVPMITTDITSAGDPHARNVLGLAGHYMKVPYFKPGYWRYQAVPVEEKLAQVRADLLGLAALGRAYGIACGFHNHAGDYVGAPIWDIREILAGTDPRWAGYYFDAGHATAEGGDGGWRTALRMALPRLKMVAVKDFYWEKAGGSWKRTVCPLGEGMVNWPAFFQILAAAKWAGPISLHVEHGTPGDPATIARDLAFLRKQLDAAYGPS